MRTFLLSIASAETIRLDWFCGIGASLKADRFNSRVSRVALQPALSRDRRWHRARDARGPTRSCDRADQPATPALDDVAAGIKMRALAAGASLMTKTSKPSPPSPHHDPLDREPPRRRGESETPGQAAGHASTTASRRRAGCRACPIGPSTGKMTARRSGRDQAGTVGHLKGREAVAARSGMPPPVACYPQAVHRPSTGLPTGPGQPGV
jgi:hypothetical protein